MKITRLHLMIAAIGAACIVYGLFNWIRDSQNVRTHQPLSRVKAEHAERRQQVVSLNQQTDDAMAHQTKLAAQSIATVGEAYKPLRRQFGDIPPISRPLRAAKQYQTQGQSQPALASAREAWLALKTFRAKAGSAMTYQVVRGDTLWKIAATHSPAREGAGWVTIWRANQGTVKDFNRLEIGWTLNIPPKRTEYEMPFWKPH